MVRSQSFQRQGSFRGFKRVSADGTNSCLRLTGKPVFSVQHHPEASPGLQDSHYLFHRFMNLIREQKSEPLLSKRA
jgi:carbamoyl-phosphate synthase small subunit